MLLYNIQYILMIVFINLFGIVIKLTNNNFLVVTCLFYYIKPCMQVVRNANKLADLVEEKKKQRNWLDYYQLKYSRNQSKRPVTKVAFSNQIPCKVFFLFILVRSFFFQIFFFHLSSVRRRFHSANPCSAESVSFRFLSSYRLGFLVFVEIKWMPLIITRQTQRDYQRR